MRQETSYDVVICGAGLAGLTLARQIKLRLPERSVAVIDRLSRPLPEAAHKVGESTNELASYYFGRMLGLEEYLLRRQLPKFSLRFFFGDPYGPFENRPELGPSVAAPIPTYQLDRGRLENDLREMMAESGVDLIEGTIVDDIDLGENDADEHIVHCRDRDGGKRFTLNGRWVVDALGRRRLLSSKLKLGLPSPHAGSSAWWRVDARLDVGKLGENGGPKWRHRVLEDRYFSTNHLVGRGYWVWLIPLSSGATSVGIVTDETIHPFQTYGRNYQQSLEWLKEHEPACWEYIKDHEPMDFKGLRNYAYNSRQIFSHRRWSCVGEAGFFLDPLYSPGSDFIAVENTMTCEMIRQDFNGELTEAKVDALNRLVLEYLSPQALDYYTDTYRVFKHAHIYTAKLSWDTATYWATLAQLFVQGMIHRPTPELFELLGKYRDLNARVQRLLIDWAETIPPRVMFAHSDMTRMKLLQLLYFDLAARRSPEQFMEVARKNLDRLEELAQLLFWQAVKECLPDRLPRDRRQLPWINAWRISLDPEQWEAEGLFAPQNEPRSLRVIRDTYAGVFAPMSPRQLLRVELPHRIWTSPRGGPVRSLVRFLLHRYVEGKPSMWLRGLFISENTSTLRRVPVPRQDLRPKALRP